MPTDPTEPVLAVEQGDIGFATSAAQHLCHAADRDAAIRLLSEAFARHRLTATATLQAEIAAKDAEIAELREALMECWLKNDEPLTVHGICSKALGAQP